jgi:CheY-like chemotaxis protein
MPHGGTLTLAGASTPEGVTLWVTDTGIGMPEEVRQHVFEPFFTTKGLRGTGLGLSVVYGIMERHGGRIEVASTPGRGTRFTLYFQAASGGDAPAPTIRSKAIPPHRVLLIDDDPMVRQAVAAVLRAIGQVVFEADSGPAGLAVLVEQSIDVLLTDLGMPGMTGWEVARTVRARFPRLPIILLTGWGDQALMESEDGALVNTVLPKPVRVDDIVQAIADVTEAPPPQPS